MTVTANRQGAAAPSGPAVTQDPAGKGAGSGSQQANENANAAVETAEAKLIRLETELETANKTRIPDLQRAISDAQKERDEAVRVATALEKEPLRVHQSWVEWAKENLPRDLYAQIENHEKERTGKVLETKAARVEALELVNDAYEKGDAPFAKFLTRQDKILSDSGQGHIARAALPALRAMYDEMKPANGQEQITTSTPAGQQPAPAAKPPLVPAPGGPPTPGGEPFFKDGDTPTSMWTRLFKKTGRASKGSAPSGG